MSILDYVFPKHCVICKKTGSYLCENCFTKLSFDTKSLCLICNNPTYNNLTHPACSGKYKIDGCFSALTYNKTTQKLIYNFKYKPYLSDLEKALVDLFFESIIQNENFNKEIKKGEWVFTGIPLYSLKQRKRGYNQSEILAKKLSKKFRSSSVNLLKRTKNTKKQFNLNKNQREENIKNAFELNSSFIIHHLSLKNANIFLVDDVVTTGASLKEASNILKRNGAIRVIGLTLARD